MSELSNEQIIHARRKVCFKMAEIIVDICDDLEDVDELARAVELALPMDRVEANAYMDKELGVDEPAEPRGPSRLRRISELVGGTPDMQVGTILDAVIAKLAASRLGEKGEVTDAMMLAFEREKDQWGGIRDNDEYELIRHKEIDVVSPVVMKTWPRKTPRGVMESESDRIVFKACLAAALSAQQEDNNA